MRIFLTGATGFIGGHLARAASREGHEIIAWVRSKEKAEERLGPPTEGLELVQAGGGDPAMQAALERADAVVNLAGESILGRWTESRKRRILDSRVQLTRSIVGTIAAIEPSRRPSVMISASAVGYYGDRGDDALDESSPPGDDFLAEVCVAWEAAAAGVQALGVRLMILRIGVVLGPDGGALQAMLPAARLGLGGPLGSGEQVMPWIHIDDLVGLILRGLVDDRYSGPIHGTAPAPVRSRELARAIGAALHRPAALRVPAFALRLGLGEAASAVLGSQRALPVRAEELGYAFEYPTVEGALADLLAPRGSRTQDRSDRPQTPA